MAPVRLRRESGDPGPAARQPVPADGCRPAPWTTRAQPGPPRGRVTRELADGLFPIASAAFSPRGAPSPSSALVCIALMLVSVNIIAAPLLHVAARPHRRAPLHPVSRHPADARQDRRADHVAVLLFDPPRRRGPVLRGLCAARARAARPVCRGGARQDPPRSLQPAALLRCRGPRGRVRAAGSAARCRQASRSISASPRPTRPTISRSSRSSSPSASAFSNTT